MKSEKRIISTALICIILLVAMGCDDTVAIPRAVGQLESERIELNADAAEPIVEILVAEGDEVAAGDALIRLDTRRVEARIAKARAVLGETQARLAELTRGPRQEQIEVGRANVRAGVRERSFRRVEFERANDLLERRLGPPEKVDETKAARDRADAQLEVYRAQLKELLEGTTLEELAQVEHRVAQAQADIDALNIDAERLTLRAPTRARVDTLLFEIGERPQPGQTLAVLLGGEQAYARVYVPEALRVQLSVGDASTVHVDGLALPLKGRVRRVANEATFTPYFALTEHDRGRLTYVAEIDILERAERLPDGVPVEVEFVMRNTP